MHMPFDGSHLFGDKSDSALEQFKVSSMAARSFGLSIAPINPILSFTPFVAMAGAHKLVYSTPRTLRTSRQPSLFVAVAMVPTEAVGLKASAERVPARPYGYLNLQIPYECM